MNEWTSITTKLPDKGTFLVVKGDVREPTKCWTVYYDGESFRPPFKKPNEPLTLEPSHWKPLYRD